MPRVAGRYSGCYVRATVSGDFSDHTLASDAHLYTCGAGIRGFAHCAFFPASIRGESRVTRSRCDARVALRASAKVERC
jgi:hypothetical protein